jgi:hypothetical protein
VKLGHEVNCHHQAYGDRRWRFGCLPKAKKALSKLTKIHSFHEAARATVAASLLVTFGGENITFTLAKNRKSVVETWY